MSLNLQWFFFFSSHLFLCLNCQCYFSRFLPVATPSYCLVLWFSQNLLWKHWQLNLSHILPGTGVMKAPNDSIFCSSWAVCHQKLKMFTAQLLSLLNTGNTWKQVLKTQGGCLAAYRWSVSVSQQQLCKSPCLCLASADDQRQQWETCGGLARKGL